MQLYWKSRYSYFLSRLRYLSLTRDLWPFSPVKTFLFLNSVIIGSFFIMESISVVRVFSLSTTSSIRASWTSTLFWFLVLEDFLGYQNSQEFLLSRIQDHNLLGEFSMHLRQACLDFWEFCTAQRGLLAEFYHKPKTNFVITNKNWFQLVYLDGLCHLNCQQQDLLTSDLHNIKSNSL